MQFHFSRQVKRWMLRIDKKEKKKKKKMKKKKIKNKAKKERK